MFKNTFLLIALTLAGCTTATSTPSSDAAVVVADVGPCAPLTTETYCATVVCTSFITTDGCGVDHQPADCLAACGDAPVMETCDQLYANICNGHCGDTVQEAPRCGSRTVTCQPCPSK